MNKHTPGPWKIDGLYIIGQVPEGRPGGEVIARCMATVSGLSKKMPHKANARLIAAAPELEIQRDALLAACKAALEMCPFPVGTAWVKEQLQNAIADAEVESQGEQE